MVAECDPNIIANKEEFEILIFGKLEEGAFVGINDVYKESHGEVLIILHSKSLPIPISQGEISILLFRKPNSQRSILQNKEESAWLNLNVIKVEEGEEKEGKEIFSNPKGTDSSQKQQNLEENFLKGKLEALMRKLALEKESFKERISIEKEKNSTLMREVLVPLQTRLSKTESDLSAQLSKNEAKDQSSLSHRELFREVIDEESEKRINELTSIFETECQKLRLRLSTLCKTMKEKREAITVLQATYSSLTKESNELEKSISELKRWNSEEKINYHFQKGKLASRQAKLSQGKTFGKGTFLDFPCLTCNREAEYLFLPCKHLVYCLNCKKKWRNCTICNEEIEEVIEVKSF